MLGEQSFADKAVLLRGKDVGAEVKIVVVVIDKLEWQHAV